MTTLTIPDELAERLRNIANDQNITVIGLLEQYTAANAAYTQTPLRELRQIRGIVDGDGNDTSTRVKEIVRDYFLKKYDDAQNAD